MKVSLVFPPNANATYAPIGLASLKAYLSTHQPNTVVQLHDLNLRVWEDFSSANIVLSQAADFMKGKMGDFYDESQFVKTNVLFNHINQQVLSLVEDAKIFLKTGALNSGLQRILATYTADVLAQDPQIIGFSILYQMQLPFALAMARHIRSQEISGKFPPRIILGGAALSIFDEIELLTASQDIEALYLGEGEEGLRMLCSGIDYSQIPGFIYREGDMIRKNKKTTTIGAAMLPCSDFSSLNLSRYFNPQPVLPVIFSRGCRWNRCRFCSHNFSYAGYRKKKFTQFAAELRQYNDLYQTRHFYIADQYINAADLRQLGDAILEQDCSAKFHVMARPSKEYTPEVLEGLYTAGCRWISWGVETGSQRLLNLCKKGTEIRTIEENLRDAAKVGISNLAMMIFGLPTSTDDDLTQTCRFLETIQDDVDAFTSSRFQLFAGTPFAANPGQFGLNIIGRELFLEIGHRPVHSHCLYFNRSNEKDIGRSYRGTYEVEFWLRRKLWIKETSFLENMTSEHYLLHVSNRQSSVNQPGFTPPKQPPYPVVKAS